MSTSLLEQSGSGTYSLSYLSAIPGIALQIEAARFDDAVEPILEEYPEESFYFLNEGALRKRARILQQHFMPELDDGKAVAYAVKANPNPRILQILSEENIAHFDCASVREIETVRNINPTAAILYNHPIKKQYDIQQACARGVTHFTAQSEREIEKILDNTSTLVDIALRMETHNADAEINLSEKFGATAEIITRLVHAIRRSTRAMPGLSLHTGSQNKNPEIFVKAIRQAADIARETGGIRTLNVGGGLPANYESVEQYDIRHYLRLISDAIRHHVLQALTEGSKVIIEPGRAMVAEAVDLVIPILSVEKRHGRHVAYIDDGIFTSFSDSAIHGWRFPFRVLRKKYQADESQELMRFTLFGRTCDSGDKIEGVLLPGNLQEGNYLHVQSAGAYHGSQSTVFNGFEPPRYVSYNL